MKNLFIGLFILLMAMPVYAKIKAKHVAGIWSYSVQTDQGNLTGTLKFIKEKKGKLSGEVFTDDGMTFSMLKVEIKDGDVVYFEIQPENDVLMVSMTIDGEAYKGVVATAQGEMSITGEKQK